MAADSLLNAYHAEYVPQRSRYLNSTKTLSALLNYGVVPIVNENDTVSVSEIKFGDNDTLSAITAAMIQADYLFLFTDVDCLYTENPRRHPETAKPVQIVRDIEAVRASVSTATLGSSLGTGGMETKLIAAELATGAGVATVITHGAKPSSILDIVSQPPGISDEQYLARTPLHTVFMPKDTPLSDRRWWVLHGLKPRGRIVIDEGAYRAIARSPSSSSSAKSAAASKSESPVPHRSSSRNHFSGNGGRLLAAGVLAVEGDFAGGQAVTIVVRKRRRRAETSDDSRTSHRPHSNHAFSAAKLAHRLLAESNGSDHVIAGTPEQSPPNTPSLSQSQELNGRHGATTTLADSIDSLHSLHISQDSSNPSHAHMSTLAPTIGEWEELEVGQGLANYNSLEIDRIKGHKSSEIEGILGYIDAEHCVESITSLRRVVEP